MLDKIGMKKFAFQQYLEANLECKFLEVGAGPLPTCGNVTDKTSLTVTAVDSLAYVYRQLLKKHQIQTQIMPEYRNR